MTRTTTTLALGFAAMLGFGAAQELDGLGAVDAHAGPVPAVARATADESRGLLTAVTFITGPEGREEEVLQELLSLSAPTRAEPGNVTYDLYRSPDRPNEFMRFEVWRDLQALEDHKVTPHLKASFERRQSQGWTTEITLWTRVAD